ncbi:MAG: hypothetical protein EBR45_10870, partial [Betaproteobacteria bacterium]|nr:hypothetical protein [Betaproteobacteria bacterium]
MATLASLLTAGRRAARLRKILAVSWRYGLDELLVEGATSTVGSQWILTAMQRLSAGRRQARLATIPRGARLRMALEALGPIFVKFGQVLSTRRDLLPADVADELALLQDQVPPFASELAIAQIESALGRSMATLFQVFETEPVASASIAQVHFARL